MTRQFTNMDSLFLASHAEAFSPADPDEAAIRSRLLSIAENLQRMDEQNQALRSFPTEYNRGVADAEARMRRRSNILANPEGEDATGRSILAQINQRVAEGAVRKIAQGERALEDKPHEFNGPKRFTSRTGFDKPKTVKPVPKAIDLDLSFLGDL